MRISVNLDTLSVLCWRVVSVLSPLYLFSRGGSQFIMPDAVNGKMAYLCFSDLPALKYCSTSDFTGFLDYRLKKRKLVARFLHKRALATEVLPWQLIR